MDDSLPDTPDGSWVVALAAGGAPDGDGYGLVVPGWLDDPAYARRMRRFLRRLGVNGRELRSMRAAAGDHQEQALTRLTLACPTGRSRELTTRLATAQAGAALAEVHGPIMHVRYVHELRRLVATHAERLAGRGLVRGPEDIFHLRLAELDLQAIGPHQVDTRRASYLRSSQGPLPPPGRSSVMPRGREPLPVEAAACLAALGGAAGTRVDARRWQGVGAASGCGQGPLKVVRDQKDLGRLEAGDVALVPDAGPAWGGWPWRACRSSLSMADRSAMHPPWPVNLAQRAWSGDKDLPAWWPSEGLLRCQATQDALGDDETETNNVGRAFDEGER